jgi:hypothetical protein
MQVKRTRLSGKASGTLDAAQRYLIWTMASLLSKESKSVLSRLYHLWTSPSHVRLIRWYRITPLESSAAWQVQFLLPCSLITPASNTVRGRKCQGTVVLILPGLELYHATQKALYSSYFCLSGRSNPASWAIQFPPNKPIRNLTAYQQVHFHANRRHAPWPPKKWLRLPTELFLPALILQCLFSAILSA